MFPVILCGGSGTRLWPVSRRHFPKQFHTLTGTHSLFQETVQRCLASSPRNEGLVVLSAGDYRFLLAEQLDRINATERTIILEPSARNTAPAIALAALHVAGIDPDAVMLVAPADHLVSDKNAFNDAVLAGIEAAGSGYLVTLGVAPNAPVTAYGYILSGSPVAGLQTGTCRHVDRFVEKPDSETAARFLQEGGYLWNSGIFLFTAGAYLSELQARQPEMLEACRRAWADSRRDFGFTTVGESYGEATALSIDYAVMEETDKAVVVPYTGDWSDIGSWSGLAATRDSDEHGNTVSGNVRLHNVSGSFILSSDRLVTGVGLEDTVIVETKDAVLVAARSEDQDVKHLVEQLRSVSAPEVSYHTHVFRPWGSYENLDRGEGFLVKRLTIKPGASISLQRHFHRSEHWVVVAGEAVVIKGEEELVLQRNESIYIPRETIHKLSNRGDRDLVIVEVQTGDYLDESDIERLKDDYGRS